MTSITSKARKPLSIAIITVMMLGLIFTSSTAEAFAATIIKAGKSGSTIVTYLGNGADGKGWDNPHTSWGKQFKYTVKFSSKEVAAYCVEPGKDFTSGKTYTAKNYTSSRAWKNLSDARKKVLALVMFYGYNNGKSAPYGNTNDYYAATQVMVWEAVQGRLYFDDGELKYKHGDDYNLIKGHSKAISNYNWMMKKIQAHANGASFMSKTSAAANTYVMKYDYSTNKFSVTKKDTRTGNYYKKTSNTSSKLSVSRSGRSYTFSTKTSGTYTAEFENYLYSNGKKISAGTSQPLLVAQPGSSSYQSVMFGIKDLTNFYAKFRTEKPGTGKIYKTSDTGVVTGFKFHVVCKENNYDEYIKVTKKSGGKGVISLSLYPGTYTVTEVLTDEQKADGYVTPATQKLVIIEGGQDSATFHNKIEKEDFKIVKTSNTGEVDGFKFTILDSDGKTVFSGTTKNGGIITGELAPGTYTVKEELTKEQIKEGWIAPEAQTLTLTAGSSKTAKFTFENVFNDHYGPIKITKVTGDNGTVAGFNFNIVGDIKAKEITASEIIYYAKASLTSDSYKGGNWTVDKEDLAALNKAAENKETGTYDVKMTCTAYAEDSSSKDLSVSITTKVTLRTIDTEDDDLAKPKAQETIKEDGNGKELYSVTWNNFEIAASGKTLKTSGTTNKLGTITTADLYPGTYTITEVLTKEQAKRYEQPDPVTIELDPDNPKSGNVYFKNEPKESHVKVIKTCSDGNVSGIEFTITGTLAWGDKFAETTIETKEDGTFEIDLQPGEYTFTETGLDRDLYAEQGPQTITVTGDETEPIEVHFKNIPITPIEVSKVSLTTQEELPGAFMQLIDKEANAVVEQWTSSEEARLIKGLEKGKTYILHEDLAPTGYRLASDIEFVAGEDEKLTMVDEPTALLITKLDGDTGEFLPGATFEIQDAEGNTLCKFEVVKDGDQVKALFTEESAAGITADIGEIPEIIQGEDMTEEDPEGFESEESDEEWNEDETVESETTQEDELQTTMTLSASEYAQIRGLVEGNTYYLIETSAPEGYTPVEDIEFVFSDCMALAIENNRPHIETTALDNDTGKHMANPGENVTITDKVAFTDLIIGKEYQLVGTLMNAETGEPVEVNGEKVTSTKTFTPETRDGYVNIEFTLDATTLAGQTTVVFEDLMYNGIKVATHAEITDWGQTIIFPKVKTTALEEDSTINVVNPDGETVIIDTAEIKNILANEEYTMKGVIVDQETGEPLLINDEQITAEKTFTATSDNLEVQLTFPAFDTTGYAGKSFVVYEYLYLGDKLVGYHTDVASEPQTIHVSDVGTQATEKDSNLNIIEPKENVVVVDTVNYYNLVPGKEYTIEGTLMIKSSGKAVKDGLLSPVKAEMKFTPEKADGVVTVEFPAVDMTKYADEDLVVFENIYYDTKIVASHADLDDPSQTLHITKLETEALVKNTGEQTVLPSEKIVVKDTVKYSNLIPGKEYTIKGVLMDKDTEEPLLIDGKQVTAETTFTPEKANGKVVMEFPAFDGSELKNKEIVVFEYLYQDTIRIGIHADIEDDAQTIIVTKHPKVVQTGDESQIMVLLALIAMGAAAVAMITMKRKRYF